MENGNGQQLSLIVYVAAANCARKRRNITEFITFQLCTWGKYVATGNWQGINLQRSHSLPRWKLGPAVKLARQQLGH